MWGLPFNVINIDDALIFKGMNEVKLINSSVDLINNTGYVNAVQKLLKFLINLKIQNEGQPITSVCCRIDWESL